MNKIIYLCNFLFLYLKYKFNIKTLNIKNIKINTEFENFVFLKLLRNQFKIHNWIIEKIKTHNFKICLEELCIRNIEVTALKTNFKCIFLCDKCNCRYTCNIYPEIGEVYSYDGYKVITCDEQIIKNLLE